MGVFDGMHRGHRALIERVRSRAAHHACDSLAITFDPHPVAVLAPGAGPHLLLPRPVKLRHFAELGIDWTWCLPFSRELAAQPAREFVERTLLPRVDPVEFWVGYDFRFGRRREGDADLLRAIGRERGFAVEVFPALLEGDAPLSSSRIRAALARGDLAEARALLGHDPILEGRVGHGRGQGAKVLVPTANLDLAVGQFLPAFGVYAAWAELSGCLNRSVVNIGLRPTLTDDPRPVVEAHLIDWEGEIRGEILSLRLSARLRAERKFPDLDGLRQAVREDIGRARDALGEIPPPIAAS